MKQLYIGDLTRQMIGSTIHLPAWVSGKRCHKRTIFLDLRDSTGMIQAIAESSALGDDLFRQIGRIKTESAVIVEGEVRHSMKGLTEIAVRGITLVGDVEKKFDPQPRSRIDTFDPALTERMLDERHMYLRNPQVMAILKFRHDLLRNVRNWFDGRRYFSVDAPILAPVTLYDDVTAMAIKVHDEEVFLTQCVGYYLEASVHAFERVYNIGPSFRGEESRSKRHLMEYWHIKAEVAWADLDDIIAEVESLVMECMRTAKDLPTETWDMLGRRPRLQDMEAPFVRISYEDAVERLASRGFDIRFGKSLGSAEEEELSKDINGPFWITGIPCAVEPFPYVIDPADPRITRVADLIAPHGYGELLGTAEKIYKLDMLEERMRSKGKHDDPRYEFVRDIHKVGCVPHAAFGMGVERMIRWLLDIPHVRDAIAFPRIFRRRIRP